MLGIRRIGGIALDFWVGAPEFFHCDKSYVFRNDMGKFSGFATQTLVKAENLMLITEIDDLSEISLNKGHIACSPESKFTAKRFFDFIEFKVIGNNKGRITVILPSVEDHDLYFQELGVRFPEIP